MEETSIKGEMTSMELELEIQKRKSEYESLEAKFRELEFQKLNIEEKLKALKRENDELQGQVNCGKDEKGDCTREKGMENVVDLTEDDNLDEDKVFQLMIENNVLECEKKKAEREVKFWQEKFKELELRISHLNDRSISKGNEQPLAERREVGLSSENELQAGADLGYMLSKDEGADLVRFGEIGGKRNDNLQPAGFPYNETPCKQSNCIKGEEKGSHTESGVDYTICQKGRKQLIFKEETSPVKKMAPSTPGGIRPSSFGIINIADSDDDEPNNIHKQLPIDNQGSVKTAQLSDYSLGGNIGGEKEMTSENSLKGTIHDQNDEDDTDAGKGTNTLASTPKRKRASNFVVSESESDDDNIPICKLKRMRLQEIGQDHVGFDLNSNLAKATTSVNDNDIGTVTPPRRRLVALKNCRRKGRVERKSPFLTSETKTDRGVHTNKDSEDEEPDEVGSDVEDEGLDDFIVSSSDVSEGDYASSESQDLSDGSVDYREIISTLQRKKDHISKWNFEADMLAAFGKDPELCMKAVCALYRQQTSEEKICKGTLYSNQRGFSKFDAPRGTTLAFFLTDGDPEGDLKKSVQELQEYDPKAIKLCRTLATHYSKQLFEIYMNREDPFFLPDDAI
ncbi:uncharacterized protein LOC107414615 [Ziziphus jujuba]|uniref:Uncharacterized protein LOC107414615 n=2 Tax=Ziziphus jujuba TaxID=326968 RepID=A0ABM4AF98_ZIZJJ|nr:uncharacterized protein LOC107414615 [Ziziphus jujuba]XP_060675413.1 uncharacterized protein LOC107414615 [Ziziphus jujuba]XP_060675414.1 uncharacterized protein LOC107414615 [Ziziphus jujuba]XP_060675415.1 uncharacterized protein LOC107414615 [Ziziphus jujuba]KAH7538161.1 hypothetical protein FEM48_Zijuj03G0169600 [Ziziphus jujuba var. spinosa]